MTETVLTVLSVGVLSILIATAVGFGYIWLMLCRQMQEYGKERELKSHHGEGN